MELRVTGEVIHTPRFTGSPLGSGKQVIGYVPPPLTWNAYTVTSGGLVVGCIDA